MFRGTFTALVTPFREGAVDYTALKGLIESQIAAGIDGIVASALIFAASEHCKGPVSVLARGGDELQVGFEKVEEGFRNVTLTGPAEFVFEGTINI